MEIARMARTIAFRPRAFLDLDQRPARTLPAGRDPSGDSGEGLLELLLLGRPRQGRGGRLPAFDRLRDGVEVTRADLSLVLDRGEPQFCRREFLLLQLHEGAHLATCVAMRQFEHAVVERVEARQRDELEAVTHGTELALELG